MHQRLAVTFLLAAVVFSSCGRKASGTDYVLSWKGDRIGVSMTVSATADTALLYTFGMDAGEITDQMEWIKDFEVSMGEVAIDTASRSFRITPVKGKACLSYTLKRTLPKDYCPGNTCIQDVFTPDIDSVMLFTHGANLFILPEEEQPVTVAWESVPPFPVFCLYNPGHGTEGFSGMSSEISWTGIIGDPLLSVDTLMIGGNKHYMVTAFRKSREYNKAAFADYCRRFYGSATTFWDEPYERPYSFVLFPFRKNTFEVTGHGFSNGFVSRYDATADTVLTIARRDVFTHEVCHTWIGSGPAWFGEGFNEMQTGYQLVAAGLDSPEYFVTYLNTALSGLWHNPHRNDPDSVAEDKFWEDGQYIWLLYWRGYSYAVHLAARIEKETGKPDAWKLMSEAMKPTVKDMSQEKFLDAMATLVSRDWLEQDFKKYILDGEDIPWNPEDIPSGMAVRRLPDGTPVASVSDPEVFAKHFE